MGESSQRSISTPLDIDQPLSDKELSDGLSLVAGHVRPWVFQFSISFCAYHRFVPSRASERSHVQVSRDWGHIRRGSRAQADKELILGREVCWHMQAIKVSAKQLRRHRHLSIQNIMLILLVHESIALRRILEPISLRPVKRPPSPYYLRSSAEVTMLRISVVGHDHTGVYGSLLVTTWWISAQNSTYMQSPHIPTSQV
jgi:hypothetical protein